MNRTRPLFVMAVLLLCSVFSVVRHGDSQAAPPSTTLESHQEWVSKCLAQIKSIKPGSTHKEFDKLFEVAGGLTDGKTYSFRQCPYFKVSAEFKDGKVVRISKPCVEEVFLD